MRALVTLRDLLPPAVAVHELRRDVQVPLFAEEQSAVARAVEKRRREFMTARECARRALLDLGLPVQAVPRGERGEPVWPQGVAGSITHCRGFRAAALAHASDVIALGLDAEPHERLPDNVLRIISLPGELEAIERLESASPDVHWSRLLFCAKEAVFKIWYPASHRWLGFDEASIELDPIGTFEVRLGPRLTLAGHRVSILHGRWGVYAGIVAAAITVQRLPHRDASTGTL